jgi:hypothetical protein
MNMGGLSSIILPSWSLVFIVFFLVRLIRIFAGEADLGGLANLIVSRFKN